MTIIFGILNLLVIAVRYAEVSPTGVALSCLQLLGFVALCLTSSWLVVELLDARVGPNDEARIVFNVHIIGPCWNSPVCQAQFG